MNFRIRQFLSHEERLRRAARHLALIHELRTILQACRQARIRCAPLRGLVLAEQLYRDPALRPMGDLDLLVRKQELPAVTMILKGMGYQGCDRRPGFAQEFSYTLEFFKTNPIHTIVEPHWSIAYPPFIERLDMEAVWRRCRPGSLLGIETQVLSCEDTLLNLCLHLVHHNGSAPLLWIDELDQLIRKWRADVDWDLLLQAARQAGVEGLVAEALRRTTDLCETPVPESFLESLARQGITSRSVAQGVIAASTIQGKESLAAFFALKGWRVKWRYAAGLLFPSPAFMQLHYGLSRSWQVWVWYPRRVLQFCLASLKGLFQLVSGS